MIGTLLGLEQPEATFLAAVVAALASLLSLVITARNAKRSERRAAQRSLVEATVEELSAVFHENVATAFTLLQNRKGSEARANALTRCKAASNRLKMLRHVCESLCEASMMVSEGFHGSQIGLPTTTIVRLARSSCSVRTSCDERSTPWLVAHTREDVPRGGGSAGGWTTTPNACASFGSATSEAGTT